MPTYVENTVLRLAFGILEKNSIDDATNFIVSQLSFLTFERFKDAHELLLSKATTRRSLKLLVEDVLTAVEGFKKKAKTSGAQVKSTVYIYEGFDEFLFPLGVNKEIITMSNKMGHIEASLKVVNDVSSKVIENSTVEKATWKDKVVNSKQKQSRTSKNNQGLLKSIGNGPRHFKKLHITSKPTDSVDDVKKWFTETDHIIFNDLKVSQLSKRLNAATFYCEFTYSSEHSPEKYKEAIPEKVIINPWIGKKNAIPMTERVHKHRMFIGFVPKKYSNIDVRKKISKLHDDVMAAENAGKTLSQMDLVGRAGSIEVRKILPKKSSQKVLDYHNYYVELVGKEQGHIIKRIYIDRLYNKLEKYCKVTDWNPRVKPPTKVRTLPVSPDESFWSIK